MSVLFFIPKIFILSFSMYVRSCISLFLPAVRLMMSAKQWLYFLSPLILVICSHWSHYIYWNEMIWYQIKSCVVEYSNWKKPGDTIGGITTEIWNDPMTIWYFDRKASHFALKPYRPSYVTQLPESNPPRHNNNIQGCLQREEEVCVQVNPLCLNTKHQDSLEMIVVLVCSCSLMYKKLNEYPNINTSAYNNNDPYFLTAQNK